VRERVHGQRLPESAAQEWLSNGALYTECVMGHTHRRWVGCHAALAAASGPRPSGGAPAVYALRRCWVASCFGVFCLWLVPNLVQDSACWIASSSVSLSFGRTRFMSNGRFSHPLGSARSVRTTVAQAVSAEGPQPVPTAKQSEEGKLADEREAKRKRLVADLLAAAFRVDRGFAASQEDRKAITAKLLDLAAFSPNAEPARSIGGRWTLLYTDAPDILGIPRTGGPFLELARIGQEIDEAGGTISNVIEWRPPRLLAGFADALAEDVLVQRVFTDYTVVSPSKVDLKIKGLGFQPRRALGIDLPDGTRFELKGPLSLPFGSFEVLYSDGELRIGKTGQGWYSVNRRDGDFPS